MCELCLFHKIGLRFPLKLSVYLVTNDPKKEHLEVVALKVEDSSDNLNLFVDISSNICFFFMHIEGGVRPSCRRSLFTLASYMLIFSARAGNLTELIPIVKASLTDKTVGLYSLDLRTQTITLAIFLQRKKSFERNITVC